MFVSKQAIDKRTHFEHVHRVVTLRQNKSPASESLSVGRLELPRDAVHRDVLVVVFELEAESPAGTDLALDENGVRSAKFTLLKQYSTPVLLNLFLVAEPFSKVQLYRGTPNFNFT